MKEDEWISINDKLPPYDLPALVCQRGKEESVGVCRLTSKTEYTNSTSFRVDYIWLKGMSSFDTYYYNITHWQYLPKCA